MSSSTSSSRAGGSGTPGAAAKNSKYFLAAMAGGLVLTATAFTLAPESFIHSGPEYGMAQAFESHIEQACAAKDAPDVLILGDSRAVAGVSVEQIRAAGIDAEKFALGGAGIFAGWATLDRLIDCGVRPKSVVMAYGTVHMIDTGAIMDRTTNYDILKGRTAHHAYDMLSKWEDRPARRLTYKAVSILGTGPTLLDLILLRPALKNVLERPGQALVNHSTAEKGRADFIAHSGDRYYGLAARAPGLPDEARFQGGIRAINITATKAIADLGAASGFDVYFYILPVSDMARTQLDTNIFKLAEDFRTQIASFGVKPLNDVWQLPDTDFGDPSHVNPIGRPIVTSDLISRLAAVRGPQVDNPVAPAAQQLEQVRQ